MIDKVLIAEDHESANISIQKTLADLGIVNTDYVYYCDDALSKIRTAKQFNKPYDLLITDLYFDADDQVQQIVDGIGLIAAARELQPEIKVLVFSAENKPLILERLLNEFQVDGYVRKARNDARELRNAIEQLCHNRQYLPRVVSDLVKHKDSHQFSEFDITIISLLANGVAQKNIPEHLERRQIRPSGLSSVEKRLNHIKQVLELTKNEQLVAFCKDMGII